MGRGCTGHWLDPPESRGAGVPVVHQVIQVTANTSGTYSLARDKDEEWTDR